MVFSRWLLTFVVVFFANTCSGSGIGQELELSLKSINTSNPEQVISLFHEVALKAANPSQKASILAFLAEFLMKNKKWHEAIDVYQQVLQEGSENDRPWAIYGIAQAHYLLGNLDKARSFCLELVTKYPGSRMESFALEMKVILPDCIHARLAEFIMSGSGSGRQGLETVSQDLKSCSSLVGEKLVADKKKRDINLGPDLSLSMQGWQSDVAGKIEAKGMFLGLQDQANFSPKTTLIARADWQISDKNQVIFDYSQFNHNGTLIKSVTYDNLVYLPGSSVRLKTNFFDVGLLHLLNENRYSVWQLLCGVKFSSLFWKLEQQMITGIRSGELNQDFRFPYVGVANNSRLSGNLSVNFGLKYFSFDSGGFKGRMADIDLVFLFGRDYDKYPSAKEWYGLLGYRYLLMRGKSGGDLSEVIYSGPVFGFESRF